MKKQYAIVPAARFEKVNLLEEWRSEVFSCSSTLNPKPLYSRKAVELVHMILGKTFPTAFFIHDYGQDGAAWDVNLINRLLMSPKNVGAIKALVEACQLIEYARDKQPVLHQELKGPAVNAIKFQATLYEAYIAYRMEKSGLKYECDVNVNGIPLDGIFDFDGQKYRVECKQPFTPNSSEFDTMRRVVDKVYAELDRVGIRGGYGFAIRLARPVQGVALLEADELIPKALQNLMKEKLKHSTELKSTSEAIAIDLLPLGVLDPGKRSSDSELVARIEVNPEQHTSHTTANGSVRFTWHFSYSHDAVIDRLRDIIQKARKQHHQRGPEKLLICVDSQELDDFRLGLFQANEVLEEDRSKLRIESALGDTLVMVTRRIYNTPKMIHRAYIFNKPEDQRLANHLQKIFRPV